MGDDLNTYGISADGSINILKWKSESNFVSWNHMKVSEEEKTNKIAISDGTTLTQNELWDWNRKRREIS